VVNVSDVQQVKGAMAEDDFSATSTERCEHFGQFFNFLNFVVPPHVDLS